MRLGLVRPGSGEAIAAAAEMGVGVKTATVPSQQARAKVALSIGENDREVARAIGSCGKDGGKTCEAQVHRGKRSVSRSVGSRLN